MPENPTNFDAILQSFREVADQYNLTAEQASYYADTLKKQREEVRTVSQAIREVGTFHKTYLNSLREERRLREELGLSTKDADSRIANFTRGMSTVSLSASSLWTSFKRGEVSFSSFTGQAGGLSNALKVAGSEMGKLALSAFVLKQGVSFLSDLTLGVGRFSVAAERAMPTLAPGNIQATGMIWQGMKTNTDLLNFGYLLAYTSKETGAVKGAMANLALSTNQYTEYGLIGQRLLGLEVGRSGDLMRLFSYRLGRGEKDFEKSGSELLRFRQYAQASGLSIQMVGDSYEGMLRSTVGMNIGLRDIPKALFDFNKQILAGTVDIGKLFGAFRTLEPSKAVGIMQMLGKGAGKSPFELMEKWYSSTPPEQGKMVADFLTKMTSGFSEKDRLGAMRLYAMQLPGVNQYTTYQTRELQEIIKTLSEGKKLDEKQVALLGRAGTADSDLIASSKQDASQFAAIDETLKGLGLKVQKAVYDGINEAGNNLGEQIGYIMGRGLWKAMLDASPGETKAFRDYNKERFSKDLENEGIGP